MKIYIKTRDFPLTDALRAHTERRLHYGLSSLDEHIQRVEVRLSDINGPRGGVDKRCRLQMVLAGLPDLIVEDTQADMYVAIDRASDRATRTLMRRMERRKTGFNRKHSRPAAESIETAYQ